MVQYSQRDRIVRSAGQESARIGIVAEGLKSQGALLRAKMGCLGGVSKINLARRSGTGLLGCRRY